MANAHRTSMPLSKTGIVLFNWRGPAFMLFSVAFAVMQCGKQAVLRTAGLEYDGVSAYVCDI